MSKFLRPARGALETEGSFILKSERQDVVRLIKGWIVPVFLLFLVLAVLAWMTLSSLVRPLAWAVLLAFISYPLFRFLLRMVGGRRGLAAFLTTLLVITLLALPTFAAGIVASREAIALVGKLADLLSGIDPQESLDLRALMPEVIVRELLPLFEQYPFLREGIQQVLIWLTSTVARISRGFLGNVVTLVYHQIIIFIAFFFLIRDAHLLLASFRDIVPLTSKERDEFMNRAVVVLRAVVFGVVVTAGVQGILGALGWWFVGLPGPLLAGGGMALLAMIPFVGTPAVWAPGALYLFHSGDVGGGILLALWGLGIVSTVDNFLRPYFISEKANMNTLLVFLGAFGGLAAWGFIGLFMGPLILGLFVFFLDTYRRAWRLYQRELIQSRSLPPKWKNRQKNRS